MPILQGSGPLRPACLGAELKAAGRPGIAVLPRLQQRSSCYLDI